MAAAVLDASALLAYLADEPGADSVGRAIGDGAAISSVNLAEVFSRVADLGSDPSTLAVRMTDDGLLHGAIEVWPFINEDAIEVARLRPLTRSAGLSLGDRACIALARRAELPVLTADRAWTKLDLEIEQRQIR
jgi:PIN domain nuclease of toxin-antitoxin system